METRAPLPTWMPAVLAAPGVALAVVGLFHPHSLSFETSERWFSLHLPGLLVFPLVAVALMVLVRGRHDPLAWLVRVSAYVYATFYSALDVISGIAAGWVTRELGPGVPRPEEVKLLFRIGGPLGEIGSIALLVCCALVTLDLVLRRELPAVAAGLVLVLGAWLVHSDHIFAPVGVVGCALLGAGTAAVAALTRMSEKPQ